MATITKDNPVFTVMVRLTVKPERQRELVDLSARMIPLFQRQPGFISLSLHRSLDGTQVVTYLQWRSQADHAACQASPEVIGSGREFMRFIETGAATIEVLPYEVVASADAR